MPIGGDLYEFNNREIEDTTTDYGVYALYDGDEVIYIGKAESGQGLREALMDHKRGEFGPCTQETTHFRRELDPSPSLREVELIEEFIDDKGRPPRCNERE